MQNKQNQLYMNNQAQVPATTYNQATPNNQPMMNNNYGYQNNMYANQPPSMYYPRKSSFSRHSNDAKLNFL